MTIEEAQQLVEVWSAKHPHERCACGNEAPTSPAAADPQAEAALGRRFWEVLDAANREGVDLTAALTATLARLNARDK